MQPTFIGIGGQKTGSTWLYLQLDRHPDVSFGVGDSRSGLMRKERHFWCRPLHRKAPNRPTIEEWPRSEDLASYLQSFDVAATTTGEISPHYAVMPQQLIERVASHLPDARLIYVVRDPRRRAWSQAWSRYSKQLAGGERGVNLATVWAQDSRNMPDDLDQDSIRFLADVLRQKGVRIHSDFGSIIQRWTTAFSRDSLLVLRSDAFQTDPRGSLSAAYSHIGADVGFVDHIDDADLKQWVNPHRPSPSTVPEELQDVLDEVYLPMVNRLEDVTGWNLDDWRR